MSTLWRAFRLVAITLPSVLGSLIITGHTMKYTWQNESKLIIHYVRVEDSRIMGTIWQYSGNSFTWTSKIYAEEFPFTNASERFIGHYATIEGAKRSVEDFWFNDEFILENKQ